MTKKPKGPRILFLDLETLPNVVTTWHIGHKVNLGYANILKERRIVCAAWKWAGDRRVWSIQQQGRGRAKSDVHILRRLYKMLHTADAVCGHNINKFDLPYIRARGLYHGLKPFPPIKQIDTLTIARRRFYFNANRLDYLGKFLGVGKKIKTDYDLWLKCMNGDKKALARMVRYNKQDVRLVEKVFNKLRPYATSQINALLYGANKNGSCACCGSSAIQYRGSVTTKLSSYSRFVCTSCGSWGRDTKRVSSATKVSV